MHGGSDPGSAVPPLVEALLEGDRDRAERLFSHYMEHTGTFAGTIDDLVRPAMEEIGERWDQGEVTVAEEHLATATMETILAQNLPAVEDVPEEAGSVLLACVEGNEHALGLRAVSDAFDLLGWETRYLGADVPTDDLVAMVDETRPDVVALSVALDQHLETAREVVERIRKLEEPRPAILVGGGPQPSSQPTDAAEGIDVWARSLQDGLEATA